MIDQTSMRPANYVTGGLLKGFVLITVSTRKATVIGPKRNKTPLTDAKGSVVRPRPDTR